MLFSFLSSGKFKSKEEKQCTGLRFRGTVRNQAKKERNLYFVTVSMKQQSSTYGNTVAFGQKSSSTKSYQTVQMSETLLMEQSTGNMSKVEDF